MDNAQSLCHSKWECKYHIVLDTKRPKEDRLRSDPERPRRLSTLISSSKRVQDFGRSLATGSYPYSDIDTTKVLRGPDHVFSEREKCYPHCPHLLGATQERHRDALLGTRLFRVHGRH